MKKIFLIIVSLVISICAQQNIDQIDAGYNATDLLVNNNEPFIALNPVNEDNIVIATNYRRLIEGDNSRWRDAHLGIYFSTDGGDNWNFRSMPKMNRVFQADPGLAFDTDGNIFCSYLGAYHSAVQGAEDDGISGIYVNKSQNGGDVWLQNSYIISEDEEPYSNDKPLLHIDKSENSQFKNRVYVAYDYAIRYGAPGSVYIHRKSIKFAFYDNQIGDFTTPAIINDTLLTSEVHAPFILTDELG